MAEEQDQEDKTEDASERRIEKAIERGDVAKSVDLGACLSMVAAGATLFAGAGFSGQMLKAELAAILGGAGGPFNAATAGALAVSALQPVVLFMAPPMLAGFLAAAGASLLMHRFVLSSEPLAPKLSRLSPMAGFKRIAGVENLVQFAKTAIKIIIGLAILHAVWNLRRDVLTTSGYLSDVSQVGALMMSDSARVFWSLMALFAAAAAADAAFQRHSWLKRLRMSKQEAKEEHKESEGSPEIKQRIRQIQRERARHRMMAAVPKASVVIANPTHFAVALQYQPGMAAPVCLAKGVDELALKIREIAAEHRIPVVENPPLARALHATAAIDEEIPVEHYKAVAEVIGHVMRLGRRRGGANRG